MAVIKLRNIVVEDIPVIVEIADRCRLSRWSYTDYTDELQRNDTAMIVAESASKACGFLVARFVPAEVRGLDAELYNIGVYPEQQGLGIGTMLLEELVHRSCLKKIQSIWLEVRASNSSAIRFYAKHGFERASIRPNFYADPVEDAIAMRLALAAERIPLQRNALDKRSSFG